MKRAFILCLTMLAMLTVIGNGPVRAASLDELRASGALGERYDGFVVVRKNVAGAAQVAAEVNAQRRRIYNERAKQQKVNPSQVGQVYAAQILRSAPPGTWFQSANGSWKQK